MLLATDLDGTFLGGTAADKEQLYSLLQQQKDIQLVFVTGRGIPSVLSLLENNALPRPEYIIGDVGATVTHLPTLTAVEPVQSHIAAKWPGDHVRETLKTVRGLLHQEAHQQYRCSYYYNDSTDIEGAREIAASLQCDLVLSAGKYLDILPAGVNKGFTLKQLLQVLALPHQKVLVAGDSMNDYSMYESGFKGVVVGDSEPELIARTAGMSNVLQAQRAGAGGILEAMSFFPEFGIYL
ncbi:HAD-superfamily hydrolase, subfamily IIB [Chitinophaga ginsengisegetis]|uniref:HAD-superfamily hydrolase, subfamily IIB n=1 Tax=Chitinophaga ginsengisegetis TaxID=393003 RepID=A0A1T5NRC0_9BACT|nr:HAD-IIB family hydrolase [Chitinophaga ginsengisegetis]MDR6565820.1 HAD superfamily hydrolase (TIGR01484 family) [Chitinophaga ginsengisegetis]MDR6645549.1 HAD superfamily hydrolase (TIGR01484 family) [Chitinophaga ginsengisegetis]MDR6651859.1 HAD superfamily hydrolase (TIGR01484 family) [Chitinophaga ginsengisegetis]SKD02793.1 HAD-superfamily hydrolase, subfamily IIB [Chitinophaga ginsengisegetis]